MNKVVVFLDEELKMNNFYNCCQYVIYEKNTSEYNAQKPVNYAKIIPNSPNQIRRDVNDLINTIKDCKVAAFGEISGIPYLAFDFAGYSIFQISEYSEDIFNKILEDIENLEQENNKNDQMINNAKPVETDTSGVYFFDLIKVQELFPEMSSKKALLDFFNLTPFMELKLICAHIPPWIESDGRFNIKAEKTGNGFNAIITYKQC